MPSLARPRNFSKESRSPGGGGRWFTVARREACADFSFFFPPAEDARLMLLPSPDGGLGTSDAVCTPRGGLRLTGYYKSTANSKAG